MEIIKELSALVSLQKLKIDDTKAKQLYKLAKDGVDEVSARELLFGLNGKSKVNFRKLKDRLTNKMIKSVIFTPYENKTDYNSVYNKSYINYSVIKVLMRYGLKKTAIPLAAKTFKAVLKYEINELVVQLSMILFRHYSLIGEATESQKYRKAYNEIKRIYDLEQASGFLFQDAITLLAREKKPSVDSLKLLNQVIKYEKSSFQLHYITMRAELIKAQIDSDLDKVMDVANQAFQYFDSLKFKPSFGVEFIFLNKRIPALILFGEFSEALSIINQCETTRRKGNRNWHLIMLYKCITGLYSSDYTLAYEAFNIAFDHLEGQSNQIKEQWLLIKAYLYFLTLTGALEEAIDFRLSKFLNELKVTYKDKRGANASALIIQMLILLAQDKRGEIIDKSETLLQYVYNYLKSEDQIRLNAMIRIIRELVNSKFCKSEFIHLSKPHLDELEKHQRKISDLEIEIIPFETCYEYIIKQL